MKRRKFLGLITAAGAVSQLGLRKAGAQTATRDAREVASDVDPYFLQTGDLSDEEQSRVASYVGFQERKSAGQDAIMPRGGRPERVPSYRFLRWVGAIGSDQGYFEGPLSGQPSLSYAPAYKMNAQILGFHTASKDWGKRKRRGALSIEFRARVNNEPMTWLFVEQFESLRGSADLGLEYVGQRGGVADPVVTDASNVDIRIQLMQESRRAGILSKILNIFALVARVSTGIGFAGAAGTGNSVLPVMRVPRMVQEGVILSQAVFGGTSQTPVWRSGFTTYAIATGGSRLALQPGLWIAIDEDREVDLSDVKLVDLGGKAGLLRNGAPIDANYLILSVEISPTNIPPYYGPRESGTPESDIQPKGIPDSTEN